MASSKSKAKPSAARRAKNKKQVKKDAAAKTARAVKGTRKVQAAKQAEETTHRLPGKKAIKTLSDKFMAASNDASVAAGVAGKIVSEAVSKLHIDSAEFKQAHRARLIGMENPARLHAKLQAWDYYREALELDKLAGLDLFQAAETHGNGEDTDDDDTGDGDEDAGNDAALVAAEGEDREGAPVH